MKMRIFALLVALLCLLCLFTISAWAGSMAFTFSYDFSLDPACATGVTKNCVDHLELWSGPVGTGSLICKWSPPAGQNTLMSNVSTTCNFPGYGGQTVNLIAVAFDGNGVLGVNSAPNTFPVTARPNAPFGGSGK